MIRTVSKHFWQDWNICFQLRTEDFKLNMQCFAFEMFCTPLILQNIWNRSALEWMQHFLCFMLIMFGHLSWKIWINLYLFIHYMGCLFMESALESLKGLELTKSSKETENWCLSAPKDIEVAARQTFHHQRYYIAKISFFSTVSYSYLLTVPWRKCLDKWFLMALW